MVHPKDVCTPVDTTSWFIISLILCIFPFDISFEKKELRSDLVPKTRGSNAQLQNILGKEQFDSIHLFAREFLFPGKLATLNVTGQKEDD